MMLDFDSFLCTLRAEFDGRNYHVAINLTEEYFMKFLKLFSLMMLMSGLSTYATAKEPNGVRHSQHYGAKKDVKNGAHKRHSFRANKRAGQSRFRRGAQHRNVKCAFGKLTVDQKTALRGARVEQKKVMVDLAAKVKVAMIAYRQVIGSADSTLDQATEAMTAVNTARSELANARSSFKLKLMYEVLDADQRMKSLRCHARSQQAQRGKKHQRRGQHATRGARHHQHRK